MIQKTLWRPDTCECEIEYSWDDSLSQENRVHTVSKIVKACSLHNNHPNKEVHFDDILSENQSKNKAIGLLVKTIAKLDGGQDEVKWRFDNKRNIILSHPLMNQKDKDDMNTLDKSSISKQVSFE